MPDPSARLAELAAVVADGAEVNWARQLDEAASDADRQDVAALRLLARIAEVHGAARWADRSAPGAGGQPADRPSLEATPTWGPLRLLAVIGHGTFGEVYRAWDPRLEREVALKLLRGTTLPTVAAEAALDGVVVHEARLMARVRHPGVATIYGTDRIDGRAGLWMELLSGPTLEEELTRHGALAADAVAHVGEAVADALAAVHRAGLLHRDVKTQNVMRDAGGRIVLTDFGTGLDHDATGEAGPLAGTPLYMAPELLQGAPATSRSDLYSLGVVLFRLATSDYPVPGQTLLEVRSAHARGLRRTLASVRPDLPSTLVRAIDRALAPDAADRFPDAIAMRDALAGARARSLRPRALTIAGALLLTAAGWLGWRTVRDHSGPPASTLAAAVALPSAGLHEVSPDPDVEDDGAPSPDGTLVSFSEDRTGHLATYEIGSRTRTTLTGRAGTQADGRAGASRFSDDGREIAFVWRPRGGQSDDIRAVPVPGGPVRRLWAAPPGIRLSLHAWSSGRNELVVIQTNEAQVASLSLVDIGTGSTRTLRSFGRKPPLFVSRSPDGRALAFDVAASDTGLRDVHVLDLETGAETAVVDGPASDHSPVWAPGASRLVFLSNRTGTIGVWTIPVEDGRAAGPPAELEANVGQSWMMGLAADKALFLARQVRLRNVHVAEFDPVTRTIQGDPRPISARSGWNGASDWSPDGRMLTFFRRDYDRYRLVVKDMATGAERELGDEAIDGIQRPRWSRDGRSILYWTDYAGENGLFRLDVATGSTTPVLVDPRFSGFEPIPNTDRVVYHVGAREFRVRSLVTGEDTPLHTVDTPFAIYGTAISRDGRWLAYTARAPQGDRLHVVDIASGAMRRDIVIGSRDERLAVFEWTPEGDGVYLVKARNLQTVALEPYQGDDSRLYWVDLGTGQVHPVGLQVNGLRVLRLSPDGRRMAMDIGYPVHTVWRLEHFFTEP